MYEELVRRINKVDMDGNPIEVPGVPSDADIDKLDAMNEALSRPLREQTIIVSVRAHDGSRTSKEITLNAARTAFRERFEGKCGNLKDIQRQIFEIDKELEIAKEDAVADKDGALKHVEDQLNADVATLVEKLELYRAQTGADVKKMQKEDKAANSEVGRKVQDFLKALQ